MEKKKILIVDDEVTFTRMVKLNLEETGEFSVLVENNGNNAVFTARLEKPDLILLDIIMPGTDGTIVMNQLKKDEATKNIPVMFLTAIVKKEETKDGMIGGYPFIAKPVETQELLNCIRKYIGKPH